MTMLSSDAMSYVLCRTNAISTWHSQQHSKKSRETWEASLDSGLSWSNMARTRISDSTCNGRNITYLQKVPGMRQEEVQKKTMLAATHWLKELGIWKVKHKINGSSSIHTWLGDFWSMKRQLMTSKCMFWRYLNANGKVQWKWVST